MVYILSQLDPASQVVFDAVNYLAAHRNAGRLWNAAHDNAWALLALNQAMLGFGDLSADFFLFGCLIACTNEPQYVPCAPMGEAAPNDTCVLEAGTDDGTGMLVEARGSVHIPVKPDAMWRARDRERRAELQMAVDPAIEVPVYRLEHYDISVEWTATNLDATPGELRIDLNGANEVFTYDPAMIVLDPGDGEAPPTPPLAGDIPIDIPANGVVRGVFREDQLLEAAIELDQISRGNVNPFAATLTVSKNAATFQQLTPAGAIP